MRDRAQEPEKRLVTLAVHTEDADAVGYEPIWLNQEVVGFVTSGGYGHCARMSMAMGYISSSIADGEAQLSVSILGERHSCRVLHQEATDPAGPI